MKLTGAEKYQTDKLEQLENYVEEQVKQNTYSLDANLALLRFYQFQPEKIKVSILAKVLLKAIMQLPQADYRACIQLVPEKLQAEESIHKVVQLANALETTRFQDFWTQANGVRDMLNPVTGFYDAVRAYILQVVRITFQKVPKKTLAEYVRLEGTSLDNMIAEKCKTSGWTIASSPLGDIIVLPKMDSQHTVKRTQDVIKFDQLLPVLKSMTVGL